MLYDYSYAEFHSPFCASLHFRNLLVCKLPEVVQHQTAALLFGQSGDCSMELVYLHPLRNNFLHAFLGLYGPLIQRCRTCVKRKFFLLPRRDYNTVRIIRVAEAVSKTVR